jgi:hypothetical protein
MSGAALEYEARSVTARTAGIFASAQPAAENLRSVAEDIVDLNGHADATFAASNEVLETTKRLSIIAAECRATSIAYCAM